MILHSKSPFFNESKSQLAILTQGLIFKCYFFLPRLYFCAIFAIVQYQIHSSQSICIYQDYFLPFYED